VNICYPTADANLNSSDSLAVVDELHSFNKSEQVVKFEWIKKRKKGSVQFKALT
jgi:hypothetical protein